MSAAPLPTSTTTTSPLPTSQQHTDDEPALPHSKPTIHHLKEVDPRWLVRLCLRLLTTLFSTVGIMCFSAALAIRPKSQSTGSRSPGYYGIYLPADALPLIPLCWSLLFAIISITHLCKLKRPLHPGWVLASDLATWIVITCLITFVIVGSDWRDYYLYYYHREPCRKHRTSSRVYGRVSGDCDPRRPTAVICELVGLAFFSASALMHFALFVWASRELDVRRKKDRLKELERSFPGYQEERGGGLAMKNASEGSRETKAVVVEKSW